MSKDTAIEEKALKSKVEKIVSRRVNHLLSKIGVTRREDGETEAEYAERSRVELEFQIALISREVLARTLNEHPKARRLFVKNVAVAKRVHLAAAKQRNELNKKNPRCEEIWDVPRRTRRKRK